MLKKLLTEPLYLPNTDYFALLNSYDEVCLDIHSHYVRRSYRNRAVVLNANGKTDLIIPVHLSAHHTPLFDVRLDKRQRWEEIHFRSLQSGYGKSAFWAFFAEEFANVYNKKHELLYEFNAELIALIAQKFGIKTKFFFSEKYLEGDDLESYDDFRGKIHPREVSVFSDFRPYKHVFTDEFYPNLSAADLLFVQGKYGKEYLPNR
jgi:hypothetical protein